MSQPEETLNQTHAIFKLARKLVANQDVDSLLIQISSAVEKLLGAEAASILLLDETKKQLTFKAATGAKGSSMKRFYVPIGQGVAGWVAQNGKPLIVNDVQSDTRFTGHIDKSSGFSTRSLIAIPLFVGNELLGVCEGLNKIEGTFTETDQNILESLGALAAVAIHNARVVEDHRNFFSHVIELLTTAVEGADSRTTGHSFRVAETACLIGRHLGIQGEAYRKLYYSSILHDIGMIGIHDLRYLPHAVSKTIERTPEKLHPLIGSELVKNIRLLNGIGPIIRHHHEFMDGTGHPDGLVGEDIPLESRIICLVECIEDLVMGGKTGSELEQAIQQLVTEGSGKKFDPQVVEAYLNLSQQNAA